MLQKKTNTVTATADNHSTELSYTTAAWQSMSWYLAPSTGQYEVSVDVFLTKLLRYIDADGAVTIVNVTLHSVTENTVSMVDFLKL